MCGRYSNHVKAMLDWSALLGEWPEEIAESHNLAPGQLIASFTNAGGIAMRWGLIPSWSREASSKYSTFNARVESVTDKPAYRHAWKQGQRCLIPALGYYEWRRTGTTKQPYFIRSSADQPLLFAGLFEPSRGDEVPYSCTMLTRPARPDLAHIHPRMPAILTLEQTRDWLRADADEALALVSGEPLLSLNNYPVSTRVNNGRNEGEDLVQPLPQP